MHKLERTGERWLVETKRKPETEGEMMALVVV